MQLESAIGQNITKLDLRDLFALFPRLQRAALYRKIKADPTIQGFVFYTSLSMHPGDRQASAALPFGPNCSTLKGWVEAKGKSINTGDTALTNSLWPIHYANITESFPMAQIDELIRLEEEAGLAELPRVSVTRTSENGLRMGDRLRNPETGAEMVVLTFGGDSKIVYNRVLVCPATVYSEEQESDPTSPDFGYRKGHQYWEWATLNDLLNRDYRVMIDNHLMPYGTLVASKREATKE